jgi:hypothetical protein
LILVEARPPVGGNRLRGSGCNGLHTCLPAPTAQRLRLTGSPMQRATPRYLQNRSGGGTDDINCNCQRECNRCLSYSAAVIARQPARCLNSKRTHRHSLSDSLSCLRNTRGCENGSLLSGVRRCAAALGERPSTARVLAGRCISPVPMLICCSPIQVCAAAII